MISSFPDSNDKQSYYDEGTRRFKFEYPPVLSTLTLAAVQAEATRMYGSTLEKPSTGLADALEARLGIDYEACEWSLLHENRDSLRRLAIKDLYMLARDALVLIQLIETQDDNSSKS